MVHESRPAVTSPCEDGTVRCGLFVLLLAACDASVEGTQVDAALPDSPAAPPDTVAMVPACASSPALTVCLPFDADPLNSPTPNFGTAMLGAILTNVTRTAGVNGGAALLTATSEISFPSNSAITGIVQIDATVRLDAEVPANGRVGVIDSEITSDGMSLFIYAGTTTSHRVRCNIGDLDVYGDTTLTLGAWVNLTCTCQNNMVAVKVDGVKINEIAGCVPANATTGGMQIGQNSRARDGLPPNEPFIGAIDRVRLWSAVQ